MDRFDAMQIFVRVVEKGSCSAVAKERGIGQPAVSKQISALEDELGTELIHRTSRLETILVVDDTEEVLRLCVSMSLLNRINRPEIQAAFRAPWVGAL